MKRVYQKRHINDLSSIQSTLEPFQNELQGIAIESTYNWYWLEDGLMDAGFNCVHLANPSAIKQYEGLKHVNDRHDACWLAHLFIIRYIAGGLHIP